MPAIVENRDNRKDDPSSWTVNLSDTDDDDDDDEVDTLSSRVDPGDDTEERLYGLVFVDDADE